MGWNNRPGRLFPIKNNKSNRIASNAKEKAKFIEWLTVRANNPAPEPLIYDSVDSAKEALR